LISAFFLAGKKEDYSQNKKYRKAFKHQEFMNRLYQSPGM
jgi:hypothetical protein